MTREQREYIQHVGISLIPVLKEMGMVEMTSILERLISLANEQACEIAALHEEIRIMEDVGERG